MKMSKGLACVLLVSLFMLSSACSSNPATEPPPTLTPMVVVTRFVTQIVATPLPATPTLVPSATPFPTFATGWDPLSVPIYYPRLGCVASRLYVGDVAYVDSLGPYPGLYYLTDIFYDPGQRDLVKGEMMFIMDGPWCVEEYLVWGVYMISDQREGFVVEGDGNMYWLFPMPPGTPTPKPTKRPTIAPTLDFP